MCQLFLTSQMSAFFLSLEVVIALCLCLGPSPPPHRAIDLRDCELLPLSGDTVDIGRAITGGELTGTFLKEIVTNIELLHTRGKCFFVSCSVCKQQGAVHGKVQHWRIVDFNVSVVQLQYYCVLSRFVLLRFNKLVPPLAAFIKYKVLKDNYTWVYITNGIFIFNPVLSYFRVRLLQHKSFA